MKVPVEMKANTEGSALSEDAIRRPLRRAGDQMPEDTPNAIFLRIPSDWVGDGGQQVEDLLKKRLQSSGGLNLVIAHWEVWTPDPTPGQPNAAIRSVSGRSCYNVNARVKLPALALLARLPATISWISLHAVLGRE
jgi:hypothetical protein